MSSADNILLYKQSAAMRIIAACKQILMPYRIALALVTWHWTHRNASISFAQERDPPTYLQQEPGLLLYNIRKCWGACTLISMEVVGSFKISGLKF